MDLNDLFRKPDDADFEENDEKEELDNIIVLNDEDGNEVEMYVVEETRINNVNYLLVTEDEGDEEEAEAYILKDISKEEDEEAVYEMVVEDSEIDYIGKVFSELLEDIDISK